MARTSTRLVCLSLLILLISGLVMRPALFQFGEIHELEQDSSLVAKLAEAAGGTGPDSAEGDALDRVLHVVEAEHWPVMIMPMTITAPSFGLTRLALGKRAHPVDRLSSPFRPPIRDGRLSTPA